MDNLTQTQIANLPYEVFTVDETTTAATFGKQTACFQIWVWDRIEMHQGDNTGGPLWYWGWVLAYDGCAGGGGSDDSSSGSSGDSSTSGSDSDSGTSTGNTGTSGSSNAPGGGSSSTGNTVITSPNSGLSPKQYQFLKRLNPLSAGDTFGQLDETAQNHVLTHVNGLSANLAINTAAHFFNTTNMLWLINQPAASQVSIVDYLIQNNFSTESEEFVDELETLSIDLEIDDLSNIWFNQYDNFRNGMSITERAIFDNLFITRRLSYMAAAKKAFDKANELYPNSVYNGKGDAYRHTLWNALTSLLIGSDLANQLTTAHEEKPFEYQYHYKEKDMDLYNNQRGRNIATFSNLSTVFENVQTALNVGSLMYLNNLEINTRKATQNSNLIPTNQ